jgi:hypothetical protein
MSDRKSLEIEYRNSLKQFNLDISKDEIKKIDDDMLISLINFNHSIDNIKKSLTSSK